MSPRRSPPSPRSAALALLMVLAQGCTSAPLSPWERPQSGPGIRERAVKVFGARFIVRVWVDPKDPNGPKAAEGALKAGIAELARVARIADADNPKSELSRLNQMAATAPVVVSPDLAAMLTVGQKLYQRTGGAFDISFAPIQEQVERHGPDAGLDGSDLEFAPSAVDLDIKNRVGQRHWTFDPDLRKVAFVRPGTKLVVKGLAKGYAAQKAAERLAGLRLRGYAVIAGTTFVAGGAALQNPQLMCVEDFGSPGRCSHRIRPLRPDKLFALSMAASGDRPGHHYNPKNGARTFALGGAAVVGPDGAWAQGAATAASILPEDSLAQLFNKSAAPPLGGIWQGESSQAAHQGTLEPYAQVIPISR